MDEGRREGRRKFLKRAGAVAWATPFILTITADRAGAQAASCAPSTFFCGIYDQFTSRCSPTGMPCCTSCVPAAEQISGAPCVCA